MDKTGCFRVRYYFSDSRIPESDTSKKILLPPGVKPADNSIKETKVLRDAVVSNKPFTLGELHEAVCFYLSQGMSPDTPVCIATADRRIAPRSKTAMIGIYPGVMSETGQLWIESKHPLRKEKQGKFAKILYHFL